MQVRVGTITQNSFQDSKQLDYSGGSIVGTEGCVRRGGRMKLFLIEERWSVCFMVV